MIHSFLGFILKTVIADSVWIFSREEQIFDQPFLRKRRVLDQEIRYRLRIQTNQFFDPSKNHSANEQILVDQFPRIKITNRKLQSSDSYIDLRYTQFAVMIRNAVMCLPLCNQKTINRKINLKLIIVKGRDITACNFTNARIDGSNGLSAYSLSVYIGHYTIE